MYFSYVKLAVASLLPVVFSTIFYLLSKKDPFQKLSRSTQQIIIGVSFGFLAVLGNEYGIPLNGAQVNARDGAVLCAGLLFGGPAGIVAGLIGGLERWFCVYWGGGSFTRVACSVSTAIAGFFAAAMRKYMFDSKKPGWGLAGVIGVVVGGTLLPIYSLVNSVAT